ncbi:MAG: hypothetical protein Q8P31_11655 [Bacillota bacterium]|nr:hypothetical protein [Bacillota bacterium]
MSLLDLVTKDKLRTVSVVGMAKNVGKTTTLNHLISLADGADLSLGLTSTGRDGERVDILTRLPKPAIFAPEGTLIATAEEVAGQGTAGLQVVKGTEYITRLGPVVIYMVVRAGAVQLVGPDTIRQTRDVVALMHNFGAELVLVDGAFDRVASAAPAVTQGTILATGAAVSPSMDETLNRTRLAVELFRLRRVREEPHASLAAGLVAEHKIGLIGADGRVTVLPIRTALEQGEYIAQAVEPDTKYVVLGGSLPGSVLRDLMKRAEVVKRVQVVLADGTRVFANARAWRDFARLGGQLRVISPIRLLAATVNPFSPLGGSYEPDEFLAKVGALAAPLPVFDVVLKRSVNTEPRRTTGRRGGEGAAAGDAAKGISEPGEMQVKLGLS